MLSATRTPAITEAPRINPVGIQYLSEQLQNAVFPQSKAQASRLSAADKKRLRTNELLLALAKDHLRHHELLGKKTNIGPPISIKNMPKLMGKLLDEHFWRLGDHQSQKYYKMASKLFAADRELPPTPETWLMEPGWTRYVPGQPPEPVLFPQEDELIFDVEVLYKVLNYPVLATCASPDAWYGWVLPLWTKDKVKERDFAHLLPFNTKKLPKLLVGYCVLYDRARCADEYDIKALKAFYLDVMAMHIAVLGICLRQRPQWLKHHKHKKILEEDDTGEFFDPEDEYLQRELSEEVANNIIDDPWLLKGLTNSLANVYQFHCGKELDKDVRELFSSTDFEDIRPHFQKAMHYCASDVKATFEVGRHLWPEFNRKTPHPVLFAALRQLGLLILPTTRQWEDYIATLEAIYQDNRRQVLEVLEQRAHDEVAYLEDGNLPVPDYENDPWLKQLDWTLKAPRLKKDGTPYKRQAYLTGYPEWYRELCKGQKINITPRTRVTPLLLRLKWEGYPLRWTDLEGWCFFVPADAVERMEAKNYAKAQLTEDEIMQYYDDLRPPGQWLEAFKVPHPDGDGKRCTLVLSKRFLPYFGLGILTLEFGYALDILALNNAALYWQGNRQRIIDQWVVYQGQKGKPETGIIIPQLRTMGTITRRATESTWLTALNAKKDRIGLELKLLIKAPPGWCFVGADVDLEELWIALLLGDAILRVHGGTALGWMTLEGDKGEGTDLHLKTAKILGINRNDAKVFNYGRIYGAGVKFATQLLKQCNPNLTDEEALKTAKALYEQTKGRVVRASLAFPRLVYHGGTELIMFNTLELIAHLDDPRTPVLGAAITDALTSKNLRANDFITLRINWTIQLLGVDYLHLLIVLMAHLMEAYNVEGRLAITVHDELRYMVRWDDRYKAALLLQIANLWTRAMFCEQVGLREVPQLVAFFSEVDLDTVLRKEVLMDCVTPLNPTPIPPGELMDIYKLLDKVTLPEPKDIKLTRHRPYEKRATTMHTLTQDVDRDPEASAALIECQNLVNAEEWRKNIRRYYQASRTGDTAKRRPSGVGTKASYPPRSRVIAHLAPPLAPAIKHPGD